MKLRNLVFVSIFALAAPVLRAQVFESYYQGFEVTETVNFITSSSTQVVYDSQLSASGSRSIKLVQSTTEVVTLITDTLDFTQNTTLHYFALEFDHINNVAINAGGGVAIGKIWVRRPGHSDWEAVNASNYNRTRPGTSEEYANTLSFNKESYVEWQQSGTPTNDWWKSERFDLDNKLGSNVPPNYRKLQIKFQLERKTSGTASGTGWWLDNIRVRASQSQMIAPTIKMRLYPDGGKLPSSRGARVEFVPQTTVSQGIAPDSVYIMYTVGSDPTPIRLQTTPVNANSSDLGAHTKYVARIPFEGYDTLMRFYCVAKDASTNHNDITFPETANSWVEYRCVRDSFGTVNYDAYATTGQSADFPFPNYADHRCEWIYDSAMLASAGIYQGAILSMRYTVAANNTRQVRPKCQIRMKNVPTSHTVGGTSQEVLFTDDYMHIVYDSTLVIDEVGAGTERTITLQDSFYYAGKDLVVQIIYDGSTNMGATSIRTQLAPNNKKTILTTLSGTATYGINAYNAFETSDDIDNNRPVFVMNTGVNQPLVYDLGIRGMTFPNETNPIVTQPSHLDVKLHNYGSAAVNGVRISYSIDDTIPGYFDWTGTLAGGAEVSVQVLTGLTLPAGYHYVRSWVEDTLTIGTARVRDHEPYNDTNLTEFIVCNGPMNGVRNIGGANADFNTIDEFLFALSQCGIDDSLVVRLADGEYPPFSMPVVPGISAQNYLVFTPAVGATATIKSNNGVASELANLENTPYVRLRGLRMVRTSGPLSSMILLGQGSTACRIENCTLIDSLDNPTSSMRIGAMINTGFANYVIVKGNVITGGDVGIDVTGQADDVRSQHNRVEKNFTYNQFSSGIRVTNQSNIIVKRNEMYDVLSNSSYVLRVMNCYDTVHILANKMYTSHGGQALGVSYANGTASLPALIANNMVVCADDGLSNQQLTPFNIIQGQWMDVVYNSVKMTAPERNNVAAATFGGGNLSNSRFFNNIVTCYDESNYAFNFMPGSATTNTIGHNVYYALGHILNKRTGGSYTTIDSWRTAVEMDSLSVSLDPTFLNGTLVDLRTFNRLVKGVGTPLTTVTTDMFDTVRSTTAPCPGAFEFVSLYYDFEPEAMLNPLPDNCDMPESVEVVLVLRNSGTSNYIRTSSLTLDLSYSINGVPGSTYNVTRTMPHEDTIIVNTGWMLSLPPNGIYDSVYNIKVWTISPNDPNQTNDTNIFQVVSRYHAVAPPSVMDSVQYNNIDTLVVTGATEWPLYNAAGAPTAPSQIYWYYSPDDEEPFQSGTTYITDTIRQDTNFYVRQHREIPIVRITQVQLFRSDSCVGLTDPMPEWIHPNTSVVVQLTNVGDDTAYVANDSVLFVSPSSGANNKLIKMPAGTTIAPGASLAIQFHNTNGLTNQLPYMVQDKKPVNLVWTTDFGVIYRSKGVKDAVAFNNVTNASSSLSVRWSTQNVPSYVWSGGGLPLANDIYCGVVRQAFNGNSGDWLYATADSPMNLAATNPAWLRYTANNCLGDAGVAAVRVIAPPAADIELDALPLPEGCFLGNETVAVRVHNFGVSPVNNLQLSYTARGNTVTETFTTPLPAGGDTVYNFVQPLNMIVDDDSLIEVVIWATHVAGDPLYANDTTWVSAMASHTPDAPIFDTAVVIDYATSDTITLLHDSISTPVWYGYDGSVVGRGSSYITDILYSEGDMAVSIVHHKDSLVHIGTLANITGKTAYPSPYQPNNKQSKQQYIYSASELRSMGLLPGAISGVSFHLDSIYKVNNTTFRDSVVFDTFSISIGFTTDTIFASNTSWKNTQLVYYRNAMPIYRTSTHDWIDHRFDTPVIWDGVQSVVVQVVTEIGTAITTGVQTAYTAKSNTTLIKNANTGVGAGYTAAGTKGNNRPDIRFLAKVFGCEGPATPFHVYLDGVPDADATIYMPDGSDTLTYSSCGDVTLNVVVRNMGRDTINGYQLHYSVDGAAYDTVTYNHTLIGGDIDSVALFSLPLMPGHHYVTAVVAMDADSVSSNDTVYTSFNVRFCAGDYTIGHDSISEYHSFTEAIDSLQVAGIDGPVVFHVAGGVYQEQVVMGPVEGSSARNSITFRGSSDTADATIVRAANTAQANYVVYINGMSNVILDSLEIQSRPASGNNAHTLVLQNCSNVTVSNSTIRSKGSINNAAASCIVVQGDVTRLLLMDNVIDSGYYSLTYVNNTTGYHNFIMQGNRFQNFHLGAINMKGLSGINLTSNTMASSYRNKQTGVYLENVDSAIVIQKNGIYLTGALTGANNVIDNNGRRGLDLKNVTGSNQQWGFIANNMIGVSSNGVSGLDPIGINVDGTSGYLSIYYNSVRVYAGATDITKSKAFASTTQTHHLQVMNNIFSNFSKAYAYHVASTNNIAASDYNAYYAAGEKFASWGGVERVDLTELQTAANRDGSSVVDVPYFISPSDLHMRMTNFVAKAQYNTDVIDDIDGVIRNQIPAPTIGAQEMERPSHDMAVIEIINPTMPVNINTPNDIESDTLLVKVRFANNGNATETNVRWYAYVVGHESSLTSPIKNIGTFSSGQMKVDSLYLPTVLGVIDTQRIAVVLLVNSDDDTANNWADTGFYLAPAYNLQAVRMTVPSGCNLEQSTIAITVKNNGFKSIPQGVQFEIGYHAQGYTSIQNNNFNANKLDISTMPDTVRETHTFDSPLARNASRDFTFNTLANLYPTDTALNIKVRVNGWCHYQYDVSADNDSTLAASSSSPQVDSWYTPDPPQGFDTTFAYATWGEVRAMQRSSHAAANLAGRPVRWYRDSTAAPFYNVNNYATSCKWSTTPQYFHDSTYYLQCFSDKNCPSHFSEVHVSVAPRVPVDVGMDGRILGPLGDRVYMENDTVKIVVSNFGNQPQSNIPVAFQVRRGNNTAPIQTVRDTIRTTIPAGQDYVHTFNELITFTSATQSGTYQLRTWTELGTDTVKRNDTIRCVMQLRPSANNNTALDYVFHALGNSYYEPTSLTSNGYVFTRISFNEIDFDIPPLNRFYTNLSSFGNPDYPVLHVRRGLSDSLFFTIVKSESPNERDRARVAAYIDYDRSGTFEDNEAVLTDFVAFTNSLDGFPVTIPNRASYGYMKMRLVTCNYEANVSADISDIPGHMVDFLIYVEPNPAPIDVAFTQIVNPRSYLIRDHDTLEVSFRVSNKGTQPVTQFNVHYRFDSDSTDSTSSGSFLWRGTSPLMGGTSAIITLPMHYFPQGTTRLTVWHDLAGDTIIDNNTLTYEYHRFHTIVIRVNDNFDSLTHWYAPVGYNNYSRNYWQLATPNKSHIPSAFSEPNAWVTDSTMVITTGRRGNVSYLYSPIINIAQIHSDTIAFRLLRNLTGGSSMRVEYYDYENNWTNLVDDTIMSDNNWYTDADELAFNGTSSGNAYNRYWCRTGGYQGSISGNFNEKLQFRFVYTTPIGSNENTSYGDGCAIDDFYIGRAQRGADVGVVAVTKPTQPKYGQTVYPEVVVKNFGYDTSRSQQVGYTYYGASLARISTYDHIIPPGATDTIQLTNSFVITSDFPDTFYITAFTIMAADIYNDNDTTTQAFVLAPLDNDISAEDFIAPLDRVIAGDSTCVVTMRIRNFGTQPIDAANLTYIVNDDFSVTEHVDFNQVLGRPLQSTEFFNYTFEEHFLASMGVMRLVGIVKCDSNEYIYNDTINKRFEGISAITDLAAKSIIVDTDQRTNIKVAMIIENRGARGANGFEVGFWVDNDTNTLYRSVYSSDLPIPALSTGYFVFDSTLNDRSAPYDHVSAYVRVPDDNDPSNDTTNLLVSKFVDLEAVEVIIEENAGEDCRVFFRIRNLGNINFDRSVSFRATINGNSLSQNSFSFSNRAIVPMSTSMFEFQRTIPKDPQRQYYGTARLIYSSDADTSNNQTTIVRVVNYVENVPEIGAGELILGQNYPNPFSGTTTVPFTLPNAADVMVFVVDAMGHIVYSERGFFPAGSNSVKLDLDRFSTGIYYYGIEVDGVRQIRKMVLR